METLSTERYKILTNFGVNFPMEAVDILAAFILAFTYEQDKHILKMFHSHFARFSKLGFTLN